MEYRYKIGDELYTVRITEQPDGFELSIGEARYHVRASALSASTLELLVEGQFYRARHAAQGAERWLALDGRTYRAERVRRRRRQGQAGSGGDALAATMPGQIVAVAVQAGDEVERGQLLVLMEAMKMELRVTAPRDGSVARVLVQQGDAVERGQTLVEMG